MKRFFFLWTLFLSVICVVGCKPDSTDPQPQPQPQPQPTEKPEITLTGGEATTNSFTFEVSATVAGELGYAVVAEGNTNPTIDEMFARNCQEIEGTATITVEELNDNTNYTLFAILRAKEGGILSDPKKLTFTTLDDGEESPITIDEIGYDSAKFTINIPGTILFQCIDQASLTYWGMSIESYFRTVGIAISENGPVSIDWYDGGMYDVYEMRMRPGSEYHVIAARCDDAPIYPNIIGDIYVKSFTTLNKPQSEANVTTNLTNITSTSVTINTVPDANVVEYYVCVRDKEWSDYFIDELGEATIIDTIRKNQEHWYLKEANEGIWENLYPETDYYCHILLVDNKGAESFVRIPFKTGDKILAAPAVQMSVTEPKENPHNTLALNIISNDAASGKVVFRPTADVAERRGGGYTDEQIVNLWGTELSADQIYAIKNIGLSIKMEDLWPEVEYTAIVSIRNEEYTETIKATTHTTPKQAPAPRVESELFTSLLGEWEMTYTLVQENNVTATISDTVTIAQGVDDKTEADYRDQNQLVIIGFPFNVWSQGQYKPIPFYGPADLLEARSNYYSKGHNLIYRDYGPKVFLQIAEGDVITMPTSKGCYLYNWSADGVLNFYGCDYDNRMTAPATFPVSLLDNGDTLVIRPMVSGEEFGYGVYYPSVFLDDYKLKACAKSEIVLKRVK